MDEPQSQHQIAAALQQRWTKTRSLRGNPAPRHTPHDRRGYCVSYDKYRHQLARAGLGQQYRPFILTILHIGFRGVQRQHQSAMEHTRRFHIGGAPPQIETCHGLIAIRCVVKAGRLKPMRRYHRVPCRRPRRTGRHATGQQPIDDGTRQRIQFSQPLGFRYRNGPGLDGPHVLTVRTARPPIYSGQSLHPIGGSIEHGRADLTRFLKNKRLSTRRQPASEGHPPGICRFGKNENHAFLPRSSQALIADARQDRPGNQRLQARHRPFQIPQSGAAPLLSTRGTGRLDRVANPGR